MKHFGFYYFLTVVLLYVFYFGVPSLPSLPPSAKSYAAHPTKEQLASHMVQFYDRHGEEIGQCSATAIGPHAFLTAEHCNERGKAVAVRFDLATEFHDLIAATYDYRDHVIYFVSGTPFTNLEEVKEVEYKGTSAGDTVVLYGDGEELYPPFPKYGNHIPCYDPSDVDEASGIACFSIHPVEGDSGSAIYNAKGEIVSLLTYGAPDGSSEGFALNFSAEQLEGAKNFDGKIPEPDDINSLIQQMIGASPKE